MWKRAASLGVLMFVLNFATHARAMGMEDFDDKPLIDGNYSAFENIMPLLNHAGRVYHYWVNGNEQFYYKGNTDALNAALKEFADVKSAAHEFVLRAGPGVTHSFNATREISFNWDVHIHDGISQHLSTLEKGDKVWSPSPVLTVYVGDDIVLNDIKIPEGVTVIELADLSKRMPEALVSNDKTVRGWGAGELARVNPYDAENLSAIVKLLKDDDIWVRLNAAGALITFGWKARSALPELRETLDGADDQLKSRLNQTIDAIEHAEDKSEDERLHTAVLQSISQFRKSLPSK